MPGVLTHFQEDALRLELPGARGLLRSGRLNSKAIGCATIQTYPLRSKDPPECSRNGHLAASSSLT